MCVFLIKHVFQVLSAGDQDSFDLFAEHAGQFIWGMCDCGVQSVGLDTKQNNQCSPKSSPQNTRCSNKEKPTPLRPTRRMPRLTLSRPLQVDGPPGAIVVGQGNSMGCEKISIIFPKKKLRKGCDIAANNCEMLRRVCSSEFSTCCSRPHKKTCELWSGLAAELFQRLMRFVLRSKRALEY